MSSFLGRTPSLAAADDDEEGARSEPLDVHEANGGPGQIMNCYLPKKAACVGVFLPTLSPSDASAAVVPRVHSPKGKGEVRDMHRVLKIVEKRWDVNLWRIGGKSHKGSHFPVVFFTRSPCRRSPDACERRRGKQL